MAFMAPEMGSGHCMKSQEEVVVERQEEEEEEEEITPRER